jgi:hypothetical protein
MNAALTYLSYTPEWSFQSTRCILTERPTFRSIFLQIRLSRPVRRNVLGLANDQIDGSFL